MMRIPGQSGWRKNQDSDAEGSFIGGMNLDLTTNKPHIRVSPRMKIGTDDIANLGVAVGFERFNSTAAGFWTVAGARVFKTTSEDASAAFVQDAQTGTPTACSSDTSDIMFFRKASMLVVTTQADIYYNAGAGSWSDVTGTPLTSGTLHMMTQYGNRGYVTEEYKRIWSFNTSMVLESTPGNPNTFELDTYNSNNVGLFFSKIMGASNTIWLFTINAAVGQPARVFTWDGVTANTPTNSQGYILDSGGVWAAVLVNDTPYIINTEARLQVLSAQTFVDVPNGRLPFDTKKFLKNAFASVNTRPVHPNGLIIVPGNKLRVFINNIYEDGTIDEFSPSGIYEFDLNNTALGWYHINSPSLYVDSVTDWGQNRISRTGGMLYAKTPTGDGITLIGAQIYSDASSTKEIIATEDTDEVIQKAGYIVIPKIYSPNIEEAFQTLITRHRKLLDSGDIIWVKYRTSEVDPVEATITWVDTTHFTTSTNISAYEGYNVEVIQGKGSGKHSKITSVASNAGTYTATLQETYTGCTSGTAKARFQYWKESTNLADQTVQHFSAPILESTTWVEFLVAMQFTGKKDEIDDFILTNAPHKEAK